MTALRLENFGGLIPRRSKRLLPDMSATVARNVKLLSGELRGYNSPRELADFTSESFTVRRAYRIPAVDDYDDLWLLFESREVDILRSPIINDRHDRYYWAGDGRPKYSTIERIRADAAPFYLGIPEPDTAPTVSPPAGSSDTRSYVYTFVSAYGEEGPPSEATTATGNAGTWAIGNLDTTPAEAANRNITHKRIYRTVTGNTGTAFFFVAEVTLATTSYNDTDGNDVVASNNQLESTSWAEPVTDMEGFVAMPGGYLVGWAGRRLLFSEPYRPHAWPAEYELSTEFEIVGLAVWGNSLIIGTRSNPYIGQGVNPAAFTLNKMDAIEPCLSRRGMVVTVAGAYYPSVNGLVLANSGGTIIVTRDILTKEEWARYNPSDLYAAALGLQYIGFNSPNFGFVFDLTEPFKLVEFDRLDEVEGIEADRYTGNVHLIRSDRAWEWDPEGAERMFWRWKSKEFHLPKPVNFGAAKIKFDPEEINVTDDIEAYYLPYNQARFAAGPLDTIAGHAICGVQDTDQVADWTEPEILMSIAAGPLYPLNLMLTQAPAIRFIAYANGEKVFDAVVLDEKIVRMPAGFKRDVWQFELIGNTNCYSLTVAETGRELGKV